MIETSSEQISDQNHDEDHDHDHITFKSKKKSNKETEGFVYFRNMEKNGVIFFVSLLIFDFIVILVQNVSS